MSFGQSYFFIRAEDGIRGPLWSRGLGDVYRSQPKRSYHRDLAVALAYLCPDLVGPVITDDRSGLHSSYTFNINGTSFVGDERVRLTPEDTVLLLNTGSGLKNLELVSAS